MSPMATTKLNHLCYLILFICGTAYVHFVTVGLSLRSYTRQLESQTSYLQGLSEQMESLEGTVRIVSVIVPGKLPAGILWFAYGDNDTATFNFIKERVELSAFSFRTHNPTLGRALLTTLHQYKDDKGAFDWVIPLPPSMDYKLGHQWLTRLQALPLSPYEISIAVDADTACCHSLDELISDFERGGYDFAVGKHSPPGAWKLGADTDNGVMMFKRTPVWLNLQKDWLAETIKRGGVKADDQISLAEVLKSRVKLGAGNIGRILPSASCRLVPAKGESWTWGPERVHDQTLLLHRPVSILHMGEGPLDASVRSGWCQWVNTRPDEKRVGLWNRDDGGYPKDKAEIQKVLQMAYSAQECDEKLKVPCRENLGWRHNFTSLIFPMEVEVGQEKIADLKDSNPLV